MVHAAEMEPSLGLADIAATVYPPEAEGRFNMKCVDHSVDETYFYSVQAEGLHRYSTAAPGAAPSGGATSASAGGGQPQPPPPHPIAAREEGTLHICSLSVVFEPAALHLPMVRVPFKEALALEEAPETAKEVRFVAAAPPPADATSSSSFLCMQTG
jgi:hypothetical protein